MGEDNCIRCGDAVQILKNMPHDSVDLSFWSPPYFVGKSYERELDFPKWQNLLRNVIAEHRHVVKSGGFMVVNIGDILCFPDQKMPRIQADNRTGKKVSVTRADILKMKMKHPTATRYELAGMLGCSEQTVQRRLENNNVRGGKSAAGTKILLTSAMVVGWAEDAGMYLYDKRIWHKDPTWMNSRWHSTSYRAVDEFEHILVFWKPGITEYYRDRLTPSEWGEWGSRGVWRIPSVRRNGRHEAEFPEELARRVIRLFSPKGGLVLDPFVGTGTTTRVAKNENRRWIGIDCQPDYVKIAQARVDGCY